MTDQEELRKIALEIGYYEEQANDVQRQIMQLQARARENLSAIASLENLQSATETLFPIGSGVLLKAKLGKVDKVLLDVGANVIVEKTTADAIKTLQEKSENYERAATQMQQALREIAGRMEELQTAGASMQAGAPKTAAKPAPNKK